jgi:hypothetical protein
MSRKVPSRESQPRAIVAYKLQEGKECPLPTGEGTAGLFAIIRSRGRGWFGAKPLETHAHTLH